ncbi:hypothetical protein WICPIJ_004403 [Wickerhamomyces pijperi]|uniref:Uncharacterized protein n=1 Tax=Wickerhamomyces pijperi TaxID=599730 RepID=A0A9P8Q5G9_WICPI|nr:hypothetical protein WICPIJ_004403 [Wickerhamomyces pijperi]
MKAVCKGLTNLKELGVRLSMSEDAEEEEERVLLSMEALFFLNANFGVEEPELGVGVGGSKLRFNRPTLRLRPWEPCDDDVCLCFGVAVSWSYWMFSRLLNELMFTSFNCGDTMVSFSILFLDCSPMV